MRRQFLAGTSMPPHFDGAKAYRRQGVPPSACGSTQIGNLTVCSTRPPAPSGIFCTRSSTRSGSSASRLIGTIGIASGAEASAGETRAP